MAAGDTLRRITAQDQLIVDVNGNVVGLKSPNANGSDLRFDPSSVAITGGAINGLPTIQVAGQPYLGLVGSRGAPPTDLSAPNKQSMSRTKHIAMDYISSLQLVYANWYGNELSPGAAAQYSASIEYPVGTITRVTFGGSFTGTAVDGGTVLSDAVALPTPIPRGATFFVRSWQSTTAGMVFSLCPTLNNATGSVPNSGEWWTFGATTPDLTNSTSNTNNQSTGQIHRPAAIVGMTNRPSFCLVGDSRLNNGISNDATCNFYGGSGEVERAVGKAFATLNVGRPGEVLATIASGSTFNKRLALSAYCSHVINECGINDFALGTSAAATLTNLALLIARFGGKPFLQSTVSPKSASTDGWATTVNQTTDATANGPRVTFNDAIRGGVAALSGYIDVADQTESARNSGLWKPNYTADGLHGNNTACVAIETSTAFANLIQFYK